jgi:hypothetical protein
LAKQLGVATATVLDLGLESPSALDSASAMVSDSASAMVWETVSQSE